MSEPDSAPASLVIVSKCNLDLREEARRFFRQRIKVAGTGVVLGCAFIGIGGYEVGARASVGLTVNYAIAALLVVLGLAVLAVSLYAGLLNPVTTIRGNSSGLVLERRWGRPFALAWKDPAMRIDIDDRTDDPVGTAESHRHHFFEGPGPLYGNLTPSTLGPLLATARTFNAPVTTKSIELRERGEVHLIRRVRIRPAPPR